MTDLCKPFQCAYTVSGFDWVKVVNIWTGTGLGWVRILMDWIGLVWKKWTHVQLCVKRAVRTTEIN